MSTDKDERIQQLVNKINGCAIDLQKEGYKPIEIVGALGALAALLAEDLASKGAAVKYLEGLIDGLKQGSGPTLN